MWTKTAREEFADVIKRLASFAPKYAVEVRDRVKKVILLLERFPNLGPQAPESNDPSVREKILGQYRIIYRVRPEIVVIYAFVPVGEQVRL